MKINKKVLFEIGLFVVFAIFIGSTILNKTIGDMDELWNYNFANCIAKGLIPYRDFSMVQTPLLPIIAGLVLKIFSNSLLTMRILAILLGSSIMLMIYKILDKLKVNKGLNILSIIGLLFILKDYFCIDYNFFAILLTLIIIYLEIILDSKKTKNNIIIGFLAGLVFLTKQTIGAFVCISIVLYKLIFEIYLSKKEKRKISYKSILYRILGVAIPVAMLLLYLLINNAIHDFIDYAILGITTFSNKIEYINLIKNSKVIISVLSIYIPISFILIGMYIVKKQNKNFIIMLFLSLASMAIAFPISDEIHFLIGIIPAFVCNIYLINELLKSFYTKKLLFIKIYINILSYLMIIYVLIFGIINEYNNLAHNEYYGTLNHFENIPTSQENEDGIKNIEEFILNSKKQVYILNFDAAIYMIPIDKYNKNYDMFMQGNFGSKGNEGLIEELKTKDNLILLVLDDQFIKNWQHPNKVTNYIEENYQNRGTIGNFKIYEKRSTGSGFKLTENGQLVPGFI